MDNNDQIKEYFTTIANHLEMALATAIKMQEAVHNSEGDSDLFRKLSYYLSPNLQHWLTGAQAGSMKDLSELFWRREAEATAKAGKAGKQGDGHEVLTAKK